ncbi:hypothetical protein BGW37DRAFT_406628, partial [Umbelopsis sp. PMI_123]
NTQEAYPTLSDFLSNLKLSRYYAALLEVGVADDDIPQLLRIEETDLRELLDSVGMLPFHAIAFRSTLRLLRKNGDSKTISKEVLISRATIYGKNSTRDLTPYEVAINEACVKLALHNPVFLADKGALLEHAKRKLLNDGYTYKRGQSRSKLNPNARSGVSLRDAFKQRRNETAEKLSLERKKRLAELEEKLSESISSRRQAEALVKIRAKEKNAAELQQAKRILEAIVKEKSKLGREISVLKAQERKHQWYEKQKAKKRTDS